MALSILEMILVDGGATGTLFCTGKNRNIGIYKAERNDLDLLQGEKYINHCGIYFLVGDKNGVPAVYIGQANNRKNGNGVLGRVLEHKKPKEDYWTTAFIVVDKNNEIAATELNYLESICCKRAVEAKRYEIVNNCDPAMGNYSWQIECTMNDFISDMSAIFRAFGFRPFETVQDRVSEKEEKSLQPNLFLKHGDGKNPKRTVSAKCCKVSGNEYVLLKGSKVALEPTKSCQAYIRKSREAYKNAVDINGVLLENITFPSASAASSFALYASSNGKLEWREAAGTKLGDLLGE